jgi:hypothetical protein
LDLYRGQYDFTNFSTQIHDFDADIHPYPDGLFWTLPIGAVRHVDLEEGTARMTGHHLPLRDFFNIPNGLFRFLSPPSVEAAATLDIRWSGPVTSQGPVTTPGSAGTLVMCQADMTWSAHNSQGFKFVSNPSGTTSFFAQLGQVRNGVFFEEDDQGDNQGDNRG